MNPMAYFIIAKEKELQEQPANHPARQPRRWWPFQLFRNVDFKNQANEHCSDQVSPCCERQVA